MTEIQVRPFGGELNANTARFGKAISICGIFGTLEDIARPLGPIAGYVALGSLLLLCVSVPLVRALPGFREEIKILRLALALLAAISVALLAMEGTHPKFAERGVLAGTVPAIAEIQKSLLSMDKHLAVIEQNTQRTAEAIDKLEAATKRETSADPRKELANLGVKWDYDSFLQAQAIHDVPTMELFLAGGMHPKPGPGPFMWFVEHDFSEQIAQLYLSNDTFDPADVCPAVVREYVMPGFYFALRDDATHTKAKFLRTLCATIVRPLVDNLIADQDANLRAIRSFNATHAPSRPEDAVLQQLKMLTAIRQQVTIGQ